MRVVKPGFRTLPSDHEFAVVLCVVDRRIDDLLVARGSVRTSECSNTFGNTASICVNRLGFFIDLADGRAAATSVVTAVVCCCCWELF